MSQRWKTLKRRNPLWAFILAMLISMSFSRPALAAGPQARVLGILEAVSAVMHDPQLQGSEKEGERKQRVRQIIVDTFDFDEMARMALGSHWTGLTSPQRTEFVDLFGDVLRALIHPPGAAVFARARGKVWRGDHHTTSRGGEDHLRRQEDQRAAPRRLPSPEKDQRWSVYDVVVDGISLAQASS